MRQSNRLGSRGILRAAVAAAVLGVSPLVPSAQADNGTWNSNTDGNWSDSTKWLNGIVADGAGFTANFVFNITATRTVTLDANRTIGNLTFTDATTSSNDWVLSSSGG